MESEDEGLPDYEVKSYCDELDTSQYVGFLEEEVEWKDVLAENSCLLTSCLNASSFSFVSTFSLDNDVPKKKKSLKRSVSSLARRCSTAVRKVFS